MTGKKPGRPKRHEVSTNVLFDTFAPTEYERLLTAGNLADGRRVKERDAALLLWWAYIGPEWLAKYQSGETKKTSDECIEYLTEALADSGHEHHAHYSDMAIEVAIAVLEEDGLGSVERQKFRSALRQHLASKWQRVGGSLDKLERALSLRRKWKGKSD